MAGGDIMVVKITPKNQLRLTQRITTTVDSPECFDAEAVNGQIVQTPMRFQSCDSVRAKLAALGVDEKGIDDAVTWARRAPANMVRRRK